MTFRAQRAVNSLGVLNFGVDIGQRVLHRSHYFWMIQEFSLAERLINDARSGHNDFNHNDDFGHDDMILWNP